MTKILRIESCESCPYALAEGATARRHFLRCAMTMLMIREFSEGRQPIPHWYPLPDAGDIKVQRDAAITVCRDVIEEYADGGDWQSVARMARVAIEEDREVAS